MEIKINGKSFPMMPGHEITIKSPEYELLPGEFIIINNDGQKKLGLCFERGSIEVLNFEENVSDEKADKMIYLMEKILESRKINK